MYRRFEFVVFFVLLSGSSVYADSGGELEWIATVNETEVTRAYIDFVADSRNVQVAEMGGGDFDSAALDQATLKDVLLTKLLVQAAEEEGLTELPEIKQELEVAHDTLIAQLYVRRISKDYKADESALRKAYAQAPDSERYRFKYYYFNSEVDAQNALKITAKSVNSDSLKLDGLALNVEETTWLDDQMLPQEVAEAIHGLEPGHYLPFSLPLSPDQWAVVQVLDKERFGKPSFEEMQPALEADSKNAYVQSRINSIAAKAEIRFADHRTLRPNWYE